MEKLDRLGWADGLAFTYCGLRIGLRTNDPAFLPHFQPYLPPGWKPTTSNVVERLYSFRVGRANRANPNPSLNLLVGNKKLARTDDLPGILEAFENHLQMYVAEMARRRVFVHAGVVGWQGRAILIPGRSFTGKTTLVAELVRAGATYYSDEYAPLDARGRVHPYTRPLQIREDGSTKSQRYPVEELGGVPGRKPLPVGLVVVSEYKQGAKWRPRHLTGGQGALALLANTVSARRQPQVALTTLQKALEGATVLGGPRGDARTVAERILSA